MRKATPETFDSWSQAFDVCRERGRPIVVAVDGEEAKIFPSGRAETRLTKRVEMEPMLPPGDDPEPNYYRPE